MSIFEVFVESEGGEIMDLLVGAVIASTVLQIFILGYWEGYSKGHLKGRIEQSDRELKRNQPNRSTRWEGKKK